MRRLVCVSRSPYTVLEGFRLRRGDGSQTADGHNVRVQYLRSTSANGSQAADMAQSPPYPQKLAIRAATCNVYGVLVN